MAAETATPAIPSPRAVGTAPPESLPAGVTAGPHGTVALSGAALTWLRALDAAVAGQAGAWGAEEHAFPPVIEAADLARMDWFTSFPHLMTVPARLPEDDQAVERFRRRCRDGQATVPIGELAPVQQVLLPAACYPVYPALTASTLEASTLLTTRATCYRSERHFVPLRRQWAFRMREVVCVGAADDVSRLLVGGRDLVNGLCAALSLQVRWEQATDPFFRPSEQVRHLYQRLAPVKHEAVVDGIAIASVNRHHEHFGDAFDIRLGAGTAQSGCVAFGLERWLGVLAHRWGADPRGWPDPAVLRDVRVPPGAAPVTRRG